MDHLKKLKEEWKQALRNPWYIAAWVALILFVVSQHASAAEYSVTIGGDKIPDWHQDTVHVGFHVEWKHVELDLAHGVKRVGWIVPGEPQWGAREWQSGSVFAIRAYPFNTEVFRPLVMWQHTSDLFRGKPFNDKEEPTSDYYGVGMTFDIGDLDIDLLYGVFNRECALFRCGDGSQTNETMIRFRYTLWSSK